MILLEFGSQSFMFAGELVLRAAGCIVARINKFSLSWWRQKEDKERFCFAVLYFTRQLCPASVQAKQALTSNHSRTVPDHLRLGILSNQRIF